MSATSTSEYGAHVADVILRGTALGAQIGNAARSARIALQQQRLEQAQFQLQVRSMDMRQAEFQQKQAEFLQTTEEWKLRRKGLELAISSAEALGPVQKAEAANRLFQANTEMQNQWDWAKFGPLIDDALREDADARMQAYMESTMTGAPFVPPMNETLRQLYKDKPYLMASPPVLKKQAALNDEVERYRQSWRMSTAGRAGSGSRGSTLSQDFFEWQTLLQTDPALAREFEEKVINNRYKSEDPEVQMALIELKAAASDTAALPGTPDRPSRLDLAKQAFLDASQRAASRRSGKAPVGTASPVGGISPDWNDFLNMKSQGALQ